MSGTRRGALGITSRNPFVLEKFSNYQNSANNSEAEVALKNDAIDFHPQRLLFCKVRAFSGNHFPNPNHFTTNQCNHRFFRDF